MNVFFLPCPDLLSKSIEPFAAKYGLYTLPLHIHQVLLAFATYHSIFTVASPLLSRALFPKVYSSFTDRTKINWNVHVVSFIQSTFISILALWVTFTDPERASYTLDSPESTASEKRVFSYNNAMGSVQGYAAGYFLWDLMMSTRHVKIFGLGFLAHAFCASFVFALGFIPFVNFYAPVFILFELSSPFLNIHWFCDKLNLTGSRIQLYNGLLLISSFFGCRLVWGTWNSFVVFNDIYNVMLSSPPSAEDLLHQGHLQGKKIVVHPFAGKTVAPWLAIIYLGSNIVLNSLNYFWFVKMIQTVASRFSGPKKKEVEAKGKVEEEEKVWVEGTEVDVGLAAAAAIALAEKNQGLKKRTTMN